MSTTDAPPPRLESLALSAGEFSPMFSPERKSYTVSVQHAVDAVAVTASSKGPGGSLAVNGAAAESGRATAPIPLRTGSNVIKVEVGAAAGPARTIYTVKVLRSYPTPTWVRVAETNPWAPRDSAGELVFGGRMWLLGGYIPQLVSDVWSSADGAHWTQTGTIPDNSGINIPLTWAYAGKMWVVTTGGKLFASSDGATWSLVTDSAPWKGRYAAGAVVYAGKMWAMGGNGQGQLYNDVWSSTDGAHWTMETAAAPWSRRQLFSMLAVYRDKIWLLGGGVTVYHPFRAYRDVWNSSDGKNWTKVTEEAPWPSRIWSNAIVYRDRLWVFGGFRAEPTWNNFNDVWYTADGVRWHQLVSESIWSARHELSAYVHDGKLWVVGGNPWPLINDAWYLEITGLTFVTQPPIEEFAGAHYRYRARADFNESGQPVRYRLVDAPAWLTVDADTGLISGTTERVEDVPVTVEAYAAAGESARQNYTLHVIPVT